MGTVVSIVKAVSGSKYGFEAEASGLKIEGSGTTKNDKLTATYEVEMYNEAICELAVKDWSTADGMLNGTLTLTLSDAVLEGLLSEMRLDSSVASVIAAAEPALELSFENTADSGKISLKVLANGKSVATLSLSGQTSEVGDITIPNDYVDMTDEDDLYEWSYGMDFTQIVDNLEKAGIPADLLEYLEYYLLYGMSYT